MSGCSYEFKLPLAQASDVTALEASVAIFQPVANAAALALATGGDGAHRYVLSFRDFFVASNRSSPRTADGIEVVAHVSGGNWRWERLCVAHPSWLVETTWEIDSASGNDENDGRTSGTAIRTWNELMRRCAVGGVWDAGSRGATTVTVTLRGNGHVIVGSVHVRNGLKFIITGNRTVATTGITASAKADLTRASNTFASVTSSWTVASEVGRLVRDVTNSRYSWVFVDAGGGAAVIPPWCTLNEVGTPSVTNGNSTVGASLETYTLPTIVSPQLFVSGTAGSTSSFTLQNVELLSTSGTARLFASNAQPFYQNVKINGNVRFGFGTHILHNCWLAGDAAYAIDAAAYVRIVSGVSTVAWVGSAASRPQCTIELRNDVLFGAAMTVPYACRLRVLDAWFRNVTTCITVSQGSSVSFGGSAAGSLNGSGATTAIALNAGCDMTFTTSTAFNISTTNLVTVAGATTARAFDDATGAYTAARTISAANLVAAVASGGFGSKLNDPLSGCRITVDA